MRSIYLIFLCFLCGLTIGKTEILVSNLPIRIAKLITYLSTMGFVNSAWMLRCQAVGETLRDLDVLLLNSVTVGFLFTMEIGLFMLLLGAN